MLSADQVPIASISAEEAVVKILLGKAYAIEHYAGRVFRSQHMTIPVPQVIAAYRGVKLPGKYYGNAPLTNRNLFLRDDYCCQYCGREVSELDAQDCLTRDHVMPVSRGGSNTWDNVVTSCFTCNNKKGDSTPEEAGMPSQAYLGAPTRREILKKSQARKTTETIPVWA